MFHAKTVALVFALALAGLSPTATAAPTASVGKVETQVPGVTQAAVAQILQAKLAALLGPGHPLATCELLPGGVEAKYVVEAQLSLVGGQVLWRLTLRERATSAVVASASLAGNAQTIETDAEQVLLRLLKRGCPAVARRVVRETTPPPPLPPIVPPPPPVTPDNPVSGTVKMSAIFDYAATSHKADNAPARPGPGSPINSEPYTDESWDLHGDYSWQFQTQETFLQTNEAGTRTYTLTGRETDHGRAQFEVIRDRMYRCGGGAYFPRVEDMRKITWLGKVDATHTFDRSGYSSGAALRIKGAGAQRRFELEVKDIHTVSRGKDGVVTIQQQSGGCGVRYITNVSKAELQLVFGAYVQKLFIEGPVGADGSIKGRFPVVGKYKIPRTWSNNLAPEDAPVDAVVEVDLKVRE